MVVVLISYITTVSQAAKTIPSDPYVQAPPTVARADLCN